MMMKTPLRLLIALAAYQCCTALPNTNAGDVVPETKFDQLPLVTAMSSVNQVRHLPANEIISFLQADDSQCRAVSTALKSEVNTLIASDQAAFNALDTGANCPSTFQTEVNSAQTAVNNAQTAVDTATQAQAAATGSSAPITITISFTTTPSLDDFTQTSAWEAAQATYNAAVLTGATKQGELDEAEKNLVTAQSTQTEMVKACRCTAKAKYDLAVAQAQPHEAPNAASWRKAEEVICALNATSPCPSNPPANPTPPTLPAEVASVSQCKTTPATDAPTEAPNNGVAVGSCDVSAESGWTYVFSLVDDRSKQDMPAVSERSSAFSNDNAAFIGNGALDALDLSTATVEMCAGHTDHTKGQCTIECSPLVDADCMAGNVNECIKCLVGQPCAGTFWDAQTSGFGAGSRNLARDDKAIKWAVPSRPLIDGDTIYEWRHGAGWHTTGNGLTFLGNGHQEFGAYGCIAKNTCTNESPADRAVFSGQKDENVLQIRYRL